MIFLTGFLIVWLVALVVFASVEAVKARKELEAYYNSLDDYNEWLAKRRGRNE